MALERKTTEALRMTGEADLGDDNLVQVTENLVIQKGPAFYDRFMTRFAMPFRREIATAALASHIQRYGADCMEPKELAKMAWALADEFVLSEWDGLESSMEAYFQLYLRGEGKETDEVLSSMVTESQNYSL